MEDTLKMMYERALQHNDVYSKALANFVFIQVIETAHVKYNISQENIKQMCKDAVNRAAIFLSTQEDEDLYKAFAIEAIHCIEWDDPEIPENLTGEIEMWRLLSENI